VATETQRSKAREKKTQRMAEPLRVPPYSWWWSAFKRSLFASFSSEKEVLALLSWR
jgi:hypothetical protein